MRVSNYPILASTILNANFNSGYYQLNQVFGYEIQAVIVGTPTGTVKLQASGDPSDQLSTAVNAPVNWTDVANSTFTVSAAGNVMWNVTDVYYNYVRIVYTDTSSAMSTATMTATINTKGF